MSKHLAPPKNKHLKQTEPKEFKMPDIRKAVSAALPEKLSKLVPKQDDSSHSEKKEERSFNRKELITAAIAFILLAALRIIHIGGALGSMLYLIPLAAAGYEVIYLAIEQAVNIKFLGKEFVLTFSCILSAAAGQFFGAAAIMVLWRVCDVLILYAKERSRREINSVINMTSAKAKLVNADGFEIVGSELIQPGDIVEFEPGDVIGFDCCVVHGMSSVDISPLTGESDTCPVAVGSIISSGCVNITSAIQGRVINSAKDSTASRFAATAENAGEYSSKQEKAVSNFSDHAELYFVLAGVLAAILMPIFGAGWRRGLAAAAVIIAVSSLGTLTEAIHCCYDLCIGKASSAGTLIKGHTDLEVLSKAETMVFGKTGVVTEGRYEILEVFPMGIPEETMLSYAAAAEIYSDHPVAKAIIAAGKRDLTEKSKVIEVEEIPGKGVSAFVDGKHVYVGNASLLTDHGIDYQIPSRPGSAIHVAIDNQYAGHILVYDRIKDGAFEAIDELRVNGVKTSVMLTGDVRSTSRSVALTLNFDMVKPELSPDAKASAVEYLMATRNVNTTLAFIGDGISDIKALKRASVGVAIGAFDAPEAADNADIAIMGNDLRKLPGIYRLSKLAFNVSRVDTIMVCCAKAAALCLGVAGILSVGWAAAISYAATFAAIIYSFRPELFK